MTFIGRRTERMHAKANPASKLVRCVEQRRLSFVLNLRRSLVLQKSCHPSKKRAPAVVGWIELHICKDESDTVRKTVSRSMIG